MIKLAPSILSADYNLLGHQLEIVASAGADYVHIDVMDGHFVPNISMGFPIIQSLRKQSNLVFDVHLMVDNPKAFIARFAQAGADIITFHVEACTDAAEIYEIIGMIRAQDKKVGLALRPDTPLAEILEFVPHVDMVLIMSVNPGFGGQELLPESFDRARKLRDYVAGSGHNLDIQMDGGINFTNVRNAIKSGANVIVVGSAIFAHANIHAATKKFKGIFGEFRENTTKIVIFTNGAADDLNFFAQVVEDADYVICCDGGARYAAEIGITPNLIVGDFDSIDTVTWSNFKSKNVTFAEFSTEKDSTDLELALELALKRSPDEIVILGGYGNRMDHFLGNIQTLVMAAKADVKASLLSSSTKVLVVDKFAEISRDNYDYISLMPLEAEVSGITTTGLKYPLCSDTLRIGTTVGFSNEFVDYVAAIAVENGLLLAICTKA